MAASAGHPLLALELTGAERGPLVLVLALDI